MILANVSLADAQVSSSTQTGVTLTAEQVAALQDLYDRAMNLQAVRLADTIGPLRAWRGSAARVLAGRLAMNVGAPKLGRALHWLAWRESPNDPDALYYYGRHIVDRRGPLPGWEYMKQVDRTCGGFFYQENMLDNHCNFHYYPAPVFPEHGSGESIRRPANSCCASPLTIRGGKRSSISPSSLPHSSRADRRAWPVMPPAVRKCGPCLLIGPRWLPRRWSKLARQCEPRRSGRNDHWQDNPRP